MIGFNEREVTSSPILGAPVVTITNVHISVPRIPPELVAGWIEAAAGHLGQDRGRVIDAIRKSVIDFISPIAECRTVYFGSDRDTLRFWVVIDEEVSPEPSEVYRLRGHLHRLFKDTGYEFDVLVLDASCDNVGEIIPPSFEEIWRRGTPHRQGYRPGGEPGVLSMRS